MKITSTKGTTNVETIREAAKWIIDMQPSHVDVAGDDIEYLGHESEDELAAKIVDAIATEERIEDLRDEAGDAGDDLQGSICNSALRGNRDHMLACAVVILDARAMQD